MTAGDFTVTGWCLNLTHPEHLHRLNPKCDEPITLEERMAELKYLAQNHGVMEGLAEPIEALRTGRLRQTFQGIVDRSYPKKTKEK